MTKPKRFITLRRRNALYGWLFISPWVLGLLLFFIGPLWESLIFAMSRVTMGDTGFETVWVGFSNFRHMLFVNAEFNQRLQSTLLSTASAVVVITLFSLIVAVTLHGDFKGRSFYRAVFFLPVIMSTGVIFLLIQVGISGGETKVSTGVGDTLNAYLFQATSIRDLMLRGGVNADFVETVTNLVNSVFNHISKAGVQILLFLSGLAKIPRSHYEACKLEGANAWESFWRITFPILSPIIFLNVVYTMIDSFISYGMDKQGNLVMYMIQETGFGSQLQLDYAAAMCWIYMVFVIIFIALAWLIVGLPSRRVSE